jgi:hypothetical protein
VDGDASGRTLTSICCSAITILGVLRTHHLTGAQQKCQSVRQRSRNARRLEQSWRVNGGIRRFPLGLAPRRSSSRKRSGWGPGFGLDPSGSLRSSALFESLHTLRSPGDLRSRAESSAFDPGHGPPRKPTDSFGWVETFQGAP